MILKKDLERCPMKDKYWLLEYVLSNVLFESFIDGFEVIKIINPLC